MDRIKLTHAHDLPDGTYRAVWTAYTIHIERPEVELKTEFGIRGSSKGRVIIAGPDRMSVEFSNDSDDTLDLDPDDPR